MADFEKNLSNRFRCYNKKIKKKMNSNSHTCKTITKIEQAQLDP